ncbi:fungal hydrophobin [Xylariaceae sp. FL1019]|nr:fungal hydrophobin [Xylariaceae sp. FL1019]
MQFSLFFAAIMATAVTASPAVYNNFPKRGGAGYPTSTSPGYPSTTTSSAGSYPTGGDGGSGGSGGDGGSGTPYDACSGLYDSLECCSTDILGVADLNCASPGAVPTSPTDFASICAAGGQRARCCVLPVLGQSVLCQTPLGL